MKKTKLISVVMAAATVIFGPCLSSSAQAAAPLKVIGLGPILNSDPQGQCTALNGRAIPASEFSLPTTGGVVTSVTWHTAADANGEYCQVMGAINPVDSAAPQIRFRLNLPTNWNGKQIQMGGGGYDGTIPNTTGNTTLGKGPAPLTAGYMTLAGDSGHQAPGGDSNDASFALNAEALANFGYMHVKKTRDAGFAIAKIRYGQKPRRAYFSGGSTGGREGLTAAQRWPNDFDGILANYPTANFMELRLWGNFLVHAEYPTQADPAAPDYAAGWISEPFAGEIANYAVAQCDGLDGVVDGLVSNIPACRALSDQLIAHFKCPRVPAGLGCLTQTFLDRTNKVYHRGFTLNFPLANGITRYEGYNSLESVIMDLGSDPKLYEPVRDGPNAHHVARADQFTKYFITGNPNFSLLNLDPVNPGIWQARIQQLSDTIDATRPDMSAFKNKGGKIIWLHGTEDPSVSPFANARYYETIVATMGKAEADKFIRFYMVPGLAHGGGNFNPVWDNLAILDNWVDHNVPPPDKPVALGNPRVAGNPTRERPLCVWPTYWQYKGSGDSEKASSFDCVQGYNPASQFDAFP